MHEKVPCLAGAPLSSHGYYSIGSRSANRLQGLLASAQHRHRHPPMVQYESPQTTREERERYVEKLALTTCACFWQGSIPVKDLPVGPEVGQRAPDFELPVRRHRHRLSDLRGKRVFSTSGPPGAPVSGRDARNPGIRQRPRRRVVVVSSTPGEPQHYRSSRKAATVAAAPG